MEDKRVLEVYELVEILSADAEEIEEVMLGCRDFVTAADKIGARELMNEIDFAVMEKSKKTRVLPVDFSLCDIGNIEIFLALKDQRELTNDNVIAINAKNNLIDVSDRLVALIGVDDLCVVKTPDVLLITKRSEAEKVKSIVNQLKRNKHIEYL